MKFRHIPTLLILFCMGALLVLPVAAQDEAPSPLLGMLALVPDDAATQAGSLVVSYADYRVMEAMRGITNAPVLTLSGLQTEEAGLWLAAMNGLAGGIPMINLPAYIREMPAQVGFAFADMDRTLIFGAPPSQGNLVGGDFDAQSIALAYTARGFTDSMMGDVTVWCGPDGCEDGQKINIRDRNTGNPFGGDLGRNEPLAVLPGYVADSADYSVVENVVGAYQGELPSLADNPAYTALVDAAAASGQVAQMLVLDFNSIGVFESEFIPDLPAEFRAMIASYGPLPPYQAFALADVWDGADQEITLLMLVYPDAAQAEVAATELAQRLETAVSLIMRIPFAEVITERGGVIGAPVVVAGESGYGVAVVPVVAAVPGNERQSGAVGYTPSGRVFQLFAQAIYSRDIYFIASEFSLP
ncbi:MAG: hypothetical protein H6672_22320 [Anaerolineaceae bacterium]|nr:hypothetical protein [Anaerolineaceae bacterium]